MWLNFWSDLNFNRPVFQPIIRPTFKPLNDKVLNFATHSSHVPSNFQQSRQISTVRVSERFHLKKVNYLSYVIINSHRLSILFYYSTQLLPRNQIGILGGFRESFGNFRVKFADIMFLIEKSFLGMDVIYKDFLNFWPFYLYFLMNYFFIKSVLCQRVLFLQTRVGVGKFQEMT